MGFESEGLIDIIFRCVSQSALKYIPVLIGITMTLRLRICWWQKKSNVLWDLKFTTLYISLLIYVKVFSIPQGSKAALLTSVMLMLTQLYPLSLFKILKNICKTNGKIFCNKCYSVQKNSVTTTIIVPLVVSITFYYTRAVLSIKHAFSVYT